MTRPDSVLRVPLIAMSRTTTSARAKRAPRPVSEDPEWPSVPDEPITPPTERRRAWGSISYEQRYREQREGFLRIARELANASSPDEVQISHIVAEAGVSRRTFYEHFATKEECFAEMVRHAAPPLVARFVAAAQEALPLGATATFRAMITTWTGIMFGGEMVISRRFALRMWTDGLRPGSPYTEPTSKVVDAVTEVFVVAAKRLGTPLVDPLLHIAARQQVLGLFGGALHLADHKFPAAEYDRLANVVAIGLGFVPESAASRPKRAVAPRRASS